MNESLHNEFRDKLVKDLQEQAFRSFARAAFGLIMIANMKNSREVLQKMITDEINPELDKIYESPDRHGKEKKEMRIALVTEKNQREAEIGQLDATITQMSADREKIKYEAENMIAESLFVERMKYRPEVDKKEEKV